MKTVLSLLILFVVIIQSHAQQPVEDRVQNDSTTMTQEKMSFSNSSVNFSEPLYILEGKTITSEKI